MRKRLLVVQHESDIRSLVDTVLLPANFTCLQAPSLTAARHCLATVIPDLILLDWVLPHFDAMQFIHELKQHEDYRNTPIILLTERADLKSKITGLQTGADDYMTKPYEPTELIARIKSVLRRGILHSPQSDIIFKSLKLNSQSRNVSINNHPVKLSRTEFKLLEFLLRNKNKAHTRLQLLDHIWGASVYIDERSIDAQIKRLRAKLKSFEYDRFIETVRGHGYVMRQT